MSTLQNPAVRRILNPQQAKASPARLRVLNSRAQMAARGSERPQVAAERLAAKNPSGYRIDPDEMFLQNYNTARCMIPAMPFIYVRSIELWLNKLLKCDKNDQQKASRNLYLGCLLVQMQKLRLSEPFIEDPEDGDLKDLDKKISSRAKYITLLKQTDEAGVEQKMRRRVTAQGCLEFRREFKEPTKFLKDHPVPNNGLICYGACFSGFGK